MTWPPNEWPGFLPITRLTGLISCRAAQVVVCDCVISDGQARQAVAVECTDVKTGGLVKGQRGVEGGGGGGGWQSALQDLCLGVWGID